MANEPILYDMHMHTPLCKHARGEPEAYAEVAERRGLKGIVVTCHNPTNDGWSPEVRMDMAEFGDYLALVARARAAWAGRIDVRLGLECDYVPGMEPWLRELLGMAEFHHVLGSVHPQLADYRRRYDRGDIVGFQRSYFEHLALAAESGLFDTLAHPDLVKNIAPAEWDLERVIDDVRRSLDRIAAAGTAMELNTSGVNKVVAEMNPGAAILTEMRSREIPVVVNSDAHDPERVADGFEEAFDMLAAVGYGDVHIVLDRKRSAVPIAAARASLRRGLPPVDPVG